MDKHSNLSVLTQRLSVRMFASYAVVALVGAATTFLTVRMLAPRLFANTVGRMGGAGRGALFGMRDVVRAAVTRSLFVGTAASIAASAAAALLMTRRILRPLADVSRATRAIAAGRYDAVVPIPDEPELAALASDVNTLASALADVERRRSRLLGDVAHEMRTPLTAIDGFVEGMIDGVFRATPETLATLNDEVRRLHRLADDLSNVSRAEEQRFELRLQSADLARIAERAAGRLAPQFADAGIALGVRAPAPLPVEVDPDRITQVLTNLLGNALVATEPGGRVTLRAEAVGSDAILTVTDTGAGIDEADLERVFERFYRVAGRARRSSGSGVGLTIARGIARAHGGDLVATSAGRGRGAEFTLTLPLQPQDRALPADRRSGA